MAFKAAPSQIRRKGQRDERPGIPFFRDYQYAGVCEACGLRDALVDPRPTLPRRLRAECVSCKKPTWHTLVPQAEEPTCA